MKTTRLKEKERKQLIGELCYSLLGFQDPSEMAEVLMDLLYPLEVEAVAKRLKIAEFLGKGWDYEEIRARLGVGYSTIARVKTWLSLSGKGFALLLKRKASEKERNSVDESEKFDPYSWFNIKRRYTSYFWPQLVLQELIENSNKAEKNKLSQIFEKMKDKAAEFNSESNKELFRFFSKRSKG